MYLFFLRLSYYYSQFGFTTLFQISLTLFCQSQEMLYNFLMFLPFFPRQTLRHREWETFLKILWPRYQAMKLEIMRSSKTIPQPKDVLEVCRTGIWCTSCFHKGERVSVRIIQLFRNRNFSVFIWGHLSSHTHHCMHTYSHLFSLRTNKQLHASRYDCWTSESLNHWTESKLS